MKCHRDPAGVAMDGLQYGWVAYSAGVAVS